MENSRKQLKLAQNGQHYVHRASLCLVSLWGALFTILPFPLQIHPRPSSWTSAGLLPAPLRRRQRFAQTLLCPCAGSRAHASDRCPTAALDNTPAPQLPSCMRDTRSPDQKRQTRLSILSPTSCSRAFLLISGLRFALEREHREQA